MSATTPMAKTATTTAPEITKPSYVALQETIEAQAGVSGLFIADGNGLLISAKGDLTGKDTASGRILAGHLTQVVKTALTLSDSGAERVTVTIDSRSFPQLTSANIHTNNSSSHSSNNNNSGKSGASGTNSTGNNTVRQILVTKTNDYFLGISSKGQ